MISAAEVGGFPLFADLTPEQVEVVLAACTHRRVESGELVSAEGGVGEELVIVRSGRVEVFKTIRGEVDRVLETFGPGEVLGAMSFLDGRRQGAGARTTEAAELAVLTRQAFERVRQARPDVAAPFYRNLAGALASHLRVALELYREAVQFGVEATGARALSLASLVEGLRPLTVHLAGGTSLTGWLLQLDQNPAGFTVVVKESSGRVSVVPYHAILRIEAGG